MKVDENDNLGLVFGTDADFVISCMRGLVGSGCTPGPYGRNTLVRAGGRRISGTVSYIRLRGRGI